MLIAQATDAKRPRKRAGDAHGCEDLIGFAAQGSVEGTRRTTGELVSNHDLL